MRIGKIFLVLSFLLIASCNGQLQPSPIVKKDGAIVVLPNGNGVYYIRGEKDYYDAKVACKRLTMGKKHGGNDFCLNELRWQRRYGALQFLGEEKPKLLFQE